MSDENKYNDDDPKNVKKSSDFKVPPRTWVVWIAIFGGIIMLMLMRDRWETQGKLVGQVRISAIG